MHLQDSQTAAPERRCFLVFMAGIGAIALTIPVVCWGVDMLFQLFR